MNTLSPNSGAAPKSGTRRRPASKALNLLLLLPYLALLWPHLYARSEPQLFGFPFFYWYQLLWVLLSALVTGIVYLATQRN